MKRIIVLSTVFFLCLIFSIYAADEEKGVLGIAKWEAGSEISYIQYREPGLMREKGMMYGLVGFYTYRGRLPLANADIDKCMLKLEGRFSYGQVDYKNSGTLDNINDYMLEFRALGGYDFPVFKASTLTPYIGVGYRYLNDDTSGKTTSTGAWGYERESNYIYVPLGAEYITRLKNGWSIGGALEYDVFCWGEQKNHLEDTPFGFAELTNKQDRGYGIRGSIKLERNTEKLDFIIEPFLRYWSIAKSNATSITYSGVIVGYGYEPKNNSTEIGCRFAIKF